MNNCSYLQGDVQSLCVMSHDMLLSYCKNDKLLSLWEIRETLNEPTATIEVNLIDNAHQSTYPVILMHFFSCQNLSLRYFTLPGMSSPTAIMSLQFSHPNCLAVGVEILQTDANSYPQIYLY